MLEKVIPRLGLQCLTETIFFITTVAFFLLVGALTTSGMYAYKRWQWTYLYYVGKSRLHIGSTYLTYKPVAHTFITFDQGNRRLRGMMKNLILPRLHQMGVTTVLGEVDFGGGPLAASIAGAVTSTGKTLVFLSPDIFQENYRRLVVNLAIMHELEVGRPVLVPVLLLGSRPACSGRRRRRRHAGDVHAADNYTMFLQLLRDFPREISTFLQGQAHRCLVNTRDELCFWQHLRDVICEDQTN